MCGIGANIGAYSSRRATLPVTESAPMVLPWYDCQRAMVFDLPGWPVSTWYWRASLRAVSIASEPPETRYTRPVFFMSPGARAAMRSARPIVSSVMNWDECAKARRFAWRVITSAISGTPWPMEQTPAPPQPSRYFRPPLSWIQIPSARTATGYRSLRFRGKRCVTSKPAPSVASYAPEGTAGDGEASEAVASAPGAGVPGTGPAAGFLTIAGEGRERGRDAAFL